MLVRIGNMHHQPNWWRTAMWSDLRAQLRILRIDKRKQAKQGQAREDGHRFGKPPDLTLLPRIDDA